MNNLELIETDKDLGLPPIELSEKQTELELTEQPELQNNTNNFKIKIKTSNDNNYLSVIKKYKKDNITAKIWNINCLCGIPGVSNTIAIKICEQYPTIRSLLNAYSNCSNNTEQEELLANIILTETNKQHRRIGKVISKRIYEYFQL